MQERALWLCSPCDGITCYVVILSYCEPGEWHFVSVDNTLSHALNTHCLQPLTHTFSISNLKARNAHLPRVPQHMISSYYNLTVGIVVIHQYYDIASCGISLGVHQWLKKKGRGNSSVGRVLDAWVWELQFGPPGPELNMIVCMHDVYNPNEPMRWDNFPEWKNLWKITGQIARDSNNIGGEDWHHSPLTSTCTWGHVHVCSHSHTYTHKVLYSGDMHTQWVLFSHKGQYYVICK